MNNERQPYYPDQSQPTSEWFSTPNPTPSPSPSPKKSKSKLFIIIGMLALIIILTVAAISMSLSNTTRTSSDNTCLNELAYNRFMSELNPENGTVPFADIKRGTSFYSKTLFFAGNSSEYASEDKADIEKFYTTLSQYSDTSYPGTPIKIVIGSDYLNEKTKTIATQRIQQIQESLLGAGIPESSIKLLLPNEVSPEGDYVSGTVPAYLTIEANTICS